MNDPSAKIQTDVARNLGLDKSSIAGRRVKVWLTWGALFIVVVAAGTAWFTRDHGDKIQYKTQEVQRGDLTIAVTATGSLVPTNQVDVGIEVSGTIRSVEADYNDQVKIGQVLARLDTTKLEAQVLQTSSALEGARAKVLQSQASVEQAANQLARLIQVRELSGGKVPSQHDMEAAKADLDRARADEANTRALVAQTQATLDSNRTDLSKAVVHSPIDGIVLKRTVERGQTVAAALQAPVLFTLAEDLTQMDLQVDVDEADVGQVQKGQEASFTVDAYPDRSFPARITQVRYGSQTVAGVVTYKAILKVDNSSLSLRPGMTATATITVKKIKGAVLIPNGALRFSPPVQGAVTPQADAGLLSKILPHPPQSTSKPREDANVKQRRVWLLGDGELVPVDITTGATNGNVTEVTAGKIEPGMVVVVDRIVASR
jgi:HlyD family secretion protein